ncbi:hypothetical protein P389DRAFT_188798 [Cystobasidium minutum MCA 4210]|uniref:uncharacterized protein n=1 Tax=Cystobasidium minutum MCA 4210 TaxID=1397322 RepID=UPI0034CEA428|eukprot:jgi/Rhomi1/188798/estExt_fgenesh1_pg.C_3_t10206
MSPSRSNSRSAPRNQTPPPPKPSPYQHDPVFVGAFKSNDKLKQDVPWWLKPKGGQPDEAQGRPTTAKPATQRPGSRSGMSGPQQAPGAPEGHETGKRRRWLTGKLSGGKAALWSRMPANRKQTAVPVSGTLER